MADVHTSAVLRGDVTLADDVVVGPGCVLDGTLGPITVGAGSNLVGQVFLTGPLTVGVGNTFYPGACVGFAPLTVMIRLSPVVGTSLGGYDATVK